MIITANYIKSPYVFRTPADIWKGVFAEVVSPINQGITTNFERSGEIGRAETF